MRSFSVLPGALIACVDFHDSTEVFRVKPPHVLLAVSAHGYGHLSQVAPVINALRERLPELRLSVQGTFDKNVVKSRINGDFTLIDTAADVGMAMHGPSEIDWSTSQSWFREFHANWDQYLVDEIELIQSLEIDLVIADVPYLPIAAATSLNIPVVAYSSLNWVDILLENDQLAADLANEINQMRNAYGSAQYFIQPEPAIPMDWLEDYGDVQRYPIAPVAVKPRQRRAALREAMGVQENAQLVLVGLGGIPIFHVLDQWPQLENVYWLVDADKKSAREDIFNIDSLNWQYPDIVGSVDLIVTKPGYGTFTEAARCGVPVINIDRKQWAETPYLIQWLKKFVAVRIVQLEQVVAGNIQDEVVELLQQGTRPGYDKSGVPAAVELLSSLLTQD